MYALHDKFNDQIISRHRKLRNAVVARIKTNKRVAKANGQGCYLPITILDNDGEPIHPDHPEYEEVWSIEAEY
jgi:uncharacterized protein YegL